MAFLTDFYIGQNDTAEAIIILAEYLDGTLVTDNLAGASVEFHMATADGTLLIPHGAATVVDATARKLGYQWQPGDTATSSPPGEPHQAEFEIHLADGRVLTVPNWTKINVHVTAEIN